MNDDGSTQVSPARPVLQRDPPCDLCGEDQFEVLARSDRRGNDLTTVICVRCGLVSHAAIPSDEDLEAYYARTYRHDYHGEITPSPHRVLRAWRCGRRTFRGLRRYMRPGDRVFEVGAGIGCTVKAFDLAGYETTGIEPGEGFCAFSRDWLKAQLENRNLTDLPRQPTYDFVLLVHVIEHFNSPRRALQHIRGLLKPGGRLYVECPNLDAPHSAPEKLYHFAHIHNFTYRTLRMIARASGFEVDRRLSTDDDRNLMVVFRGANAEQLCLDPDSYRHTLSRVHRYNRWTYHARPRYLAQRLKSLAVYASDHFFAKTRLARLIDRCQKHAGTKQTTERRAA